MTCYILTKCSDSDNLAEHTITQSIFTNYLELIRGTWWQSVYCNLSAARGCHWNGGPVWYSSFPVPEITGMVMQFGAHTLYRIFQTHPLHFCISHYPWCSNTAGTNLVILQTLHCMVRNYSSSNSLKCSQYQNVVQMGVVGLNDIFIVYHNSFLYNEQLKNW
jgi:hypothetical protein